VFRRFEPTHRDLARFTTVVAERRENLRRLIHNLNLLNKELAGKSEELAQLVDTSAAVFRSFAAEDQNITEAVDRLPDALAQTTDTLGKVERFARTLGPAARELTDVAPAIDRANKAIRPLAEEATPIVRRKIRPFTRDAQPLVRELRPAARRLAGSTPDLTRSFVVLNHLFNLIGFNPNGREAPGNPQREEGYLYWIAWLQHNGNNAFASSDAHGVFRPVTLGGVCGAIRSSVADEPQLEFLQGLSGVLSDPNVCGAK
jgi:ABC-type transporter Mla subunit MlaD